MNVFDQRLKESGEYPLRALEITSLQVNMGYKCNLRCIHCHVEASPDREEVMPIEKIRKIIDIVRMNREIATVDITGGAPELNPSFRSFVKSCSDLGKRVLVRTNLAVYTESGLEDIPEFLKENRVKIIASLPCYTEQGVDAQRGKGTFRKAVGVFRHLNELGYGKKETDLEIDIMFNPAGAATAPDQLELEKAYTENLKETQGIVFNRLIALGNMPIGRLGKSLSPDAKNEYLQQLSGKFNPQTVKSLMCRQLVSISPEGRIYDCDFWQMLNIPLDNEERTIEEFDYERLKNRKIVTGPLCLLCTAGAGASCSGALA